MFDHAGIVVADLSRSADLYTAALAPLGIRLLQDNRVDGGEGWLVFGTMPGAPFLVVAAGRPSFWANQHSVSRSPVHLAFVAPDRAAVDTFHARGTSLGALDNGPPGMRSVEYYAAYLLDFDGNNIEAGMRG